MAIREQKKASTRKNRKLGNRVGRRLELTGMVFHYLTVDGFNGIKNNKSQWNCTCKCGNKVVVTGKDLVNHNNKSCGCWHKEYIAKIKKDGIVTANHTMYCKYRHGATSRGIHFDLREEDFNQVIHSDCYYCGDKPQQVYVQNKKYHPDVVHNGVDRINNNVGYIKNNIVPCCSQCNTMKMDYSMLEFIDKVKKIHQRFCNGD